MDSWNSDLLLHVIQFLPLRDLGRFSATGKRHLFLVKKFQQLLGNQLSSTTSKVPHVRTRQRTSRDVIRSAIDQLQTRPTWGISFQSMSSAEDTESLLPSCLPQDTTVLGVRAGKIQSCGAEVECRSSSSLMLGSFPNAKLVPFVAQSGGPSFQKSVPNLDSIKGSVRVAMIFACGDFDYDELQDSIHMLQNANPDAAIVGGICDGGFISIPNSSSGDADPELEGKSASVLRRMAKRLGSRAHPNQFLEKEDLKNHILELLRVRSYTSVEDGFFGVLMSGDVPVKSVVSRGMRSMTFQGTPQPETPFYVKEAYYRTPDDEEHVFGGESVPAYHQIARVENRITGQTYSFQDLLSEFGSGSTLIGIRGIDEDGFSLYDFHQLSGMVNSFILFDAGLGTEPLVGRNVDLFQLDGNYCLKDVEVRMSQLKEALQHESLLGAIMISCSGRGPEPSGMMRSEMADAKQFARSFPGVPCLGFYAGGEIGPLAQAARRQVFQAGKAALQGFTAVFAVFVVPKIDLSKLNLDDRQENVNAFTETYMNDQGVQSNH